MVKTLKLKHPVTIDGRKLDELTYDEEQITGNLICEAEIEEERSHSGDSGGERQQLSHLPGICVDNSGQSDHCL